MSTVTASATSATGVWKRKRGVQVAQRRRERGDDQVHADEPERLADDLRRVAEQLAVDAERHERDRERDPHREQHRDRAHETLRAPDEVLGDTHALAPLTVDRHEVREAADEEEHRHHLQHPRGEPQQRHHAEHVPDVELPVVEGDHRHQPVAEHHDDDRRDAEEIHVPIACGGGGPCQIRGGGLHAPVRRGRAAEGYECGADSSSGTTSPPRNSGVKSCTSDRVGLSSISTVPATQQWKTIAARMPDEVLSVERCMR